MGDLGLIPELRRSPGEGKDYPLQYSGLESSMDFTHVDMTEQLSLHFKTLSAVDIPAKVKSRARIIDYKEGWFAKGDWFRIADPCYIVRSSEPPPPPGKLSPWGIYHIEDSYHLDIYHSTVSFRTFIKI